MLLETKNFFIYCRFLHHLKKKVKNNAHVEGSIIESYLIEEISQFCSYYFESNVQPYNFSTGRNGDEEVFPDQNSGGISVDIDLPTTLVDSEGRFDEVSESDDDDHGLINDNVMIDNNIDDNEEYAEEEMMDNESDEDEGFSDQSNNERL
jgi:hypothetical protein